jgi:TonB family protein
MPFGPPTDRNAPFGLPLTPAPQQMPPKIFRPPSKVIGIVTPAPDASPTTRSAVTMIDSPATRPTNKIPTTRPTALREDVATIESTITDRATTRPVTVAAKERRPDGAPVGELPPATQPIVQNMPATLPTAPGVVAVAVASSSDTGRVADVSPLGPSPLNVPANAGDAKNKSESESDAFTKHPTLTYRNGKVEAQDGRKVKAVRPHFSEAGIQALITGLHMKIVLAAHIDEQGKVTGVDILTSSGSNEVDLPMYRAMYDWVFDPTKDIGGKPIPDVLVITWEMVP